MISAFLTRLLPKRVVIYPELSFNIILYFVPRSAEVGMLSTFRMLQLKGIAEIIKINK
jgi:hypothetical protein